MAGWGTPVDPEKVVLRLSLAQGNNDDRLNVAQSNMLNHTESEFALTISYTLEVFEINGDFPRLSLPLSPPDAQVQYGPCLNIEISPQ
jgi:hypothetical protein